MNAKGGGPSIVFDRAMLRQRRERVARDADRHAFLLERAADEIVERIGFIKRNFPVVVDLGSHHGVLAQRLACAGNVGMVISAEAAPQLVARCPSPKVQADEELLPFADGSLDLVVSALALQHVNDLPGTLAQIRRALKPDGLLLAAMLGGETLRELREAFLVAEAEVEGGASPRVAPFVDVRELGGLLQRAGFALPVTDTDTVTVTYASPLDLMAELRGMGATNVLAERRRTPLRRATLMRAMEVYVERFGTDGRIPATFEIMLMTGWAPHDSQQKPLRPGSAQVSLAQVLKPRG